MLAVQVEPFEIERFYERWEFRAELMLSSSDCESRPVSELLALEPDAHERLLGLHLGYTEVPGSEELREAIAAMHDRCEPQDVLALAAAEEGIFTAYHALLGPGDHVVVEAPCYGSAIALARSTGAEVSLWRRRHEDRWAYDLDELERLLRSDTALVYVNSPHNPTGSQMSRAELERLIEMLRERGTALLSDEVYRGLEHDPDARLPAACDLYERAISLNTVSKAYGLPGLRIGWLVSRDARMLERIRELKLYTTICSSAPSELLVALALRHAEQLMQDSRALVLENLPLLEQFLGRHQQLFEWVRPTAGPIGFPRILDDRDVRAWCEATAAEAGVLLLPGDVYEQPRHVRLGYGRRSLPAAIERLEQRLMATAG
jgi:aspartate/methionine/tyrosine aminotransferase